MMKLWGCLGSISLIKDSPQRSINAQLHLYDGAQEPNLVALLVEVRRTANSSSGGRRDPGWRAPVSGLSDGMPAGPQ